MKVDAATLAELKKLMGKMPLPQSGLTDKNKRFLRQFDDPAVLHRLHDLPGQLWAEVRRETRPSFRTLAKAQAALALSIVSYMPLRLQNLAALAFDVHLFVQADAHAISSLEIPAAEVKNSTDLAFDIPRHIAKMLMEYRDRIAEIILVMPTGRYAHGSPRAGYGRWRCGYGIPAEPGTAACAVIEFLDIPMPKAC